MKFKVTYNGITEEFTKKLTLMSLIDDLPVSEKRKYICAKVNNRVRDLFYEVYYDCEVEFLTLDNHSAMKTYEASLRYVIAMAFRRCYPDLRIKFAYNISRSVSVHLLGDKYKADMAMYLKIKHEIDRIISADYPLIREIVSVEEAAKIYEQNGFEDKKSILRYRPEKTVHFYKCDGYRNYMYSHLVPSTGYITNYRFRLFSPGFIIQYPRSECKGDIPSFVEAPTYGRTLKESHDWAKIVGVDTVARINNEIETAGPVEFINICEDRHNRMLVELGQLIEDDIDRIRLICVAGPSSSGKTTFANRLRIELLSRGIKPIRISIDDYYKPSSEIPIGEDGERDLETIDALDVEFFQQNMLDLINGVETQLPKFDFKIGKRVMGRKIKIDKDVPIIIEGIHALNDELSDSIPKSAKFKIFISPQAQINLDDHNPISLTDLRLIRRMVRDKKFRNAPAEETLSMWKKVRAGEFKWIYPFQEGCDYVFNSFMPYELPILKKYAMPLLSGIDKDSPYFVDAERLLRLLKFFVDMPDNWVPNNSLMREFIGGSCYADV